MKTKLNFYQFLSFFLAIMLVFLPLFSYTDIALPAAAADANFNPFGNYEEEAGMYLYKFEGTLTNPCSASSRNSKPEVINQFWFDFSYYTENGTGKSEKYRLDLSYSGGQNKNNDFVTRNFVRSNDDSCPLSFELWLPGMLTQMDMHLELNGYISLFNYERMSFEINRITCGGIKINASPDTDYVSSSTASSDGTIGIKMNLVDGEYIKEQLHVNKLTIKEFEQKITGDEKFHDQYGAVLETNALKNLTLRCDSDINQSFSHADETDWYLYTLVMNVENPVCTKNSYPDSVEKFYIDFEYKPENGYSNETKTYRLDMSWNDTRNLNENCLQKFRNEDETPFVTELTIWLPGILQKMNVFLEMRDLNLLHMAKNDRLTVRFSDIRLNGFNINRNIDYISSAGGESKAEISCIAPSALINLQYLDETSTKQALDAINNANTEYQFKDQYGAIVSSILVKKAMEEMQDCFNVALNSSNTSIKEYSVSVENQAMSGSLYHASQNEIIQEYMEQKILEKRMQMQ